MRTFLAISLLIFAAIVHGQTACPVLKPSGPLAITSNNQIVENLDISTPGTVPGITCNGFDNVIIRNVRVTHYPQGVDAIDYSATKSTGSRSLLTGFELAVPPPPPGSSTAPYSQGIQFTNCNNILIDTVRVQLVGFPSGPFSSFNNYNIIGKTSNSPVIRNTIVSGGSSGVWLGDCESPTLSNWAAYNMHGPFPRGQCAQLARSNNGVVEDFICKNQWDYSWPEDAMSMWRSANSTVRRGLFAGNNANTGTGLMFEQSMHLDNSWGLAQDLQAYNIGGACFSTYGGTNIFFDNVQCKDNTCVSEGGRQTSLGALMFFAGYENPGNYAGCCPSSDISISGEWYNNCDMPAGWTEPKGMPDFVPGKVLGVSTMNPDAWKSVNLTMTDWEINHHPIQLQMCFTIDGEKYVASTVTGANVGLYGDGKVDAAAGATTTMLNAVAETAGAATTELATTGWSSALGERMTSNQSSGWSSVFAVAGVLGLLALMVGVVTRRASTGYTSVASNDLYPTSSYQAHSVTV